jgi:hypothetical protein
MHVCKEIKVGWLKVGRRGAGGVVGASELDAGGERSPLSSTSLLFLLLLLLQQLCSLCSLVVAAVVYE